MGAGVTDPDACVIPHRTAPDRPRRAVEGLRVCVGHYAQLERALIELPDLHEELPLALHPENAWQRGVGQKLKGHGGKRPAEQRRG